MGYWEIVVPEGVNNLHPNPSVETNTTSWQASGSAVAQSPTYQRWGAYCLQITTNNAAANEGTTHPGGVTGIAATAATDYTWSVWMRGTGTVQLWLQWFNGAGAAISTDQGATITLSTTWTRYTQTETSPALTAYVAPAIFTNVQQNIVFYVDGAQLEQADHETTYCDGTQIGCEWNGTAHASTSTRSALSRAGGRVYDLTDDYGFYVTNYIDSGVAPLTQHLDEYAIIPGGEVAGYKVHPRVMTLAGHMHSRVGFSTLHDQIQGLIDILKPDAVPNNQPVLLRYTEATVEKEIAVYYEAGLEGSWRGERCAEQNFAIRFLAADPFWYEIGESAAVLDTSDSATFSYVAARLRETGQWDPLGPPSAGGTVWTITIDNNKYIVIGGNFLNWDGDAAADYIVYWDGDSWEPST